MLFRSVAGNCSAILRWDLPECKKATFATGSNPTGVAFDGTALWVTNFGADTVSRINTTTGTRTDFPTGANPREVAFDGANIWVVNRNGISVTMINPATGATIGTLATGNIPNGLAFDGTSIWVANFGSDMVSRIDHEVLGSTLSQPRPRRRTS